MTAMFLNTLEEKVYLSQTASATDFVNRKTGTGANKLGRMMKDRCFEFQEVLKAGFDLVDGKDEEIVKFAKDYVETLTK